MMKNTGLLLNLLDWSTLPEDILYIGTAGFEERSLGFLKDATIQKKRLKFCIAIEYLPFDIENRKSEFAALAAKIFCSVEWKTYDRPFPQKFTQVLHEIVEDSRFVSRVVVDISAMSKMLVAVLLNGLKNLNCPLSIVYAPAKSYYPLRDVYEKKAKSKPESFPYFLTSDVYRVVSTTELSSIAMQGAPLIMVAFPNFNYREIAALLNETNAQKLYLIESVRDLEEDAWRLEAIRWINRGLKTYVTPLCETVVSSDTNANIRILDRIYDNYHLTHKIAVAPTGGKLQAVATFCLKIMHPDIHILYPVVREFEKDYTEGYLPHLEIFFKNFRDYTNTLDRHRQSSLSEINEILRKKNVNIPASK
jgi:hypothetical protein